MLKITSSEDYYPTPESFLEQIMDGWDWEDIECILDPSAGKGNIAEYAEKAKEKWSYHTPFGTSRLDIDCIEIESELRAILKDKKLRVVHDGCLTFHTYKHYDLILMTPPVFAGSAASAEGHRGAERNGWRNSVYLERGDNQKRLHARTARTSAKAKAVSNRNNILRKSL